MILGETGPPPEGARRQLSFLSLLLGLFGVALSCGGGFWIAFLICVPGILCSIHGLSQEQSRSYTILGLLLNGLVLVDGICLLSIWVTIWRALTS